MRSGSEVVGKPLVDGWTILFFVMAAIGLYGMAHVFFYGQEPSYGVTRYVSWGLLIIGYSFLVGITTGLSLLVIMCHLFGLKHVQLMERKLILLALTALLGGFYVIFWDLGGPFKLQIMRFVINYFPPHITSAIWWMSTLYALELPIIIIEIYLIFTKNHKWLLPIAIISFLVGISAYSNMGFVFAANISRPFWFGAYIPIFFILSALGLGAGFGLILCYFTKKLVPSLQEKLSSVSSILERTLFFVVLAMMFFTGWRFGTALYTYQPEVAGAAMALLWGKLSFNFWFFQILLGLIVPFFMLIKKPSNVGALIAAILVIIGIFFERYNTIVAGQLVPVNSVYYDKIFYVNYTPSLSEISLFISALGIAGLLYLIGDRILNKKFAQEVEAEESSH
jgi:Ni/Fe-hydrogenase subunit HybB-like protein